MKSFISYIQIVTSLMLIFLLLLQGRGGGLGSAFGGKGELFQQRRGVEKIAFISTIVLSAVFFISSILNFIFV